MTKKSKFADIADSIDDAPPPREQKAESKTELAKRNNPQYKQTSMYLPITLLSKAKLYSTLEGKNMSEIFQEILAQWVQQMAAKHDD